MPKNVTVDEFIGNAIKVYNLKPLSPEKKRDLKFKLRMAGIQDHVISEDTKLALDIILESTARPVMGTIRIGNVHTSAQHGLCPRCHQPLTQAKLADSREVGYCQSCCISVT